MSALKEVTLELPAKPDAIAALELGSIVYLNGVVYTARERVYERVLRQHIALPDGLAEISNANFHCSPAAARQDDGSFSIGGVTATASFRFSKYMAEWLDLTATKIVIGKGGMPDQDYQQVFAARAAVYLTTVGYGTGALLGRGVVGVEAVHWLAELGLAQALWMFRVKNFGPFLVASDMEGNSLFAEHSEIVNRRIQSLYEGLQAPALHRYGETSDRKKELI